MDYSYETPVDFPFYILISQACCKCVSTLATFSPRTVLKLNHNIYSLINPFSSVAFYRFRNAIQHTCFSTKKHMDFFVSLSFSPVTTGAGAGDRRARPSARASPCPRRPWQWRWRRRQQICDLSFHRKKIVICDLWRLEVEEGWRLLDLNPKTA